MTVEYRLKFPPYTLWGYERDLARREAEALLGGPVTEAGAELRVVVSQPVDAERLRGLTFFHRVEERNGDGPRSFVTRQALLESTAKLGRQASSLQQVRELVRGIGAPSSGRKESRYITHGIHDYKGKFYPQLVKALMTHLGARQGSVVLDPFLGSGTTLVESYLGGMIGIGVDMNPLAYLISQAKVGCLSLPADLLVEESHLLMERVQASAIAAGVGTDAGPLFGDTSWRGQVDELRPLAPFRYDEEELEYLLSWFPTPALAKFFVVLREIDRIENAHLRTFFRVLLSDLVRQCSQQDPRQLRIRRRGTPITDAPVLELFRERITEATRLLAAFLWARDAAGIAGADWEVLNGDSRDLRALPSRYLAQDGVVDLVVTSPPYATALPYLDTDRLSLALLRLTVPRSLRRLETVMIGNREIVPRARVALEQDFLSRYDSIPLPTEVKELIRLVYDRNAAAAVGFRRKNMAALLYKYFDDMRMSMLEAQRVLKPGGRFALVVGNNITTVGDAEEDVEIRTDRYLGLIGQQLGMRLVEDIPITVTTEDLAHARNSITENTIVVLEAI